ncbi:hypothetical protein [Ralstonia sp. 1138]
MKSDQLTASLNSEARHMLVIKGPWLGVSHCATHWQRCQLCVT